MLKKKKREKICKQKLSSQTQSMWWISLSFWYPVFGICKKKWLVEFRLYVAHQLCACLGCAAASLLVFYQVECLKTAWCTTTLFSAYLQYLLLSPLGLYQEGNCSEQSAACTAGSACWWKTINVFGLVWPASVVNGMEATTNLCPSRGIGKGG